MLLKLILPFSSYMKIYDEEFSNKKCSNKKCTSCYKKDIIKLKININKIIYYLRLYIKRFRK